MCAELAERGRLPQKLAGRGGEEERFAELRINHAAIARGQLAVGIGIGLHSGPVVVGSIGSPERLEYTAIGSTVNLASRVGGRPAARP